MIARKKISKLQAAEMFVTEYFHTEISPVYSYHNLDHTKQVVCAVQEIGTQEKVNAKELEILKIAAWFHDTGFKFGAQNHEINGAQIASIFLSNFGTDANTIETVANCILATRLPHNPSGLLEEIMCDADLRHLASSDFAIMNQRLRVEWAQNGMKFTDQAWINNNMNFFKAHKYFTSYGRNTLQVEKWKNYEVLPLADEYLVKFNAA